MCSYAIYLEVKKMEIGDFVIPKEAQSSPTNEKENMKTVVINKSITQNLWRRATSDVFSLEFPFFACKITLIHLLLKCMHFAYVYSEIGF